METRPELDETEQKVLDQANAQREKEEQAGNYSASTAPVDRSQRYRINGDRPYSTSPSLSPSRQARNQEIWK